MVKRGLTKGVSGLSGLHGLSGLSELLGMMLDMIHDAVRRSRDERLSSFRGQKKNLSLSEVSSGRAVRRKKEGERGHPPY